MYRRKEGESAGAKLIAISTGTIFRSVLMVLALYFLYAIRDIVALFLVALLIAALINPFAERLRHFGIPCGLAVLVLYLVGFALFVGVAVLAVPPMLAELSALVEYFTPFLAHTQFANLQALVQSGAFSENLGTIAATVQQAGVLEALPQLGAIVAGAFGGVLGFFLVLMLAYYMVTEENVVRRAIALFSPAEYQPFVTQLSVKMQDKVGSWLAGQLFIMLVIFALDYVVLSALGIPYALVLALFGGLMEVIPFIGPNVSVIPAVIIALSVSPVHAVLVLVGYFVIQQLESNVLTPKIMQKATGLNPIVTILAILIGFQVGGILGAFLSIPIAVALSVFFSEVFRGRVAE